MEKDLDKLVSLLVQLKRAAHQFHCGTLEEKLGTMLQLHVMFFLERSSHVTLNEISRYTGGSPSSTTQLINRLHKAGLVQRAHDTKDRRIIRHSLTKEGLVKLQEMKEEKIGQMKQFFSTLDASDIKTLINILEKLLYNVKKKTAV